MKCASAYCDGTQSGGPVRVQRLPGERHYNVPRKAAFPPCVAQASPYVERRRSIKYPLTAEPLVNIHNTRNTF